MKIPRPSDTKIKVGLMTFMLLIVALTFVYCYYTQEPHDESGAVRQALPASER